MAQVYMFIFMAILPVIVVYLFMGRSIVAGLTAGAVKG
jgi:multiple sugar transport system permease protein